MTPKRRPQAVEMTQFVVHQVIGFLRNELPARLERGRTCEYEILITIRDGIVQLSDVQFTANDDKPCAPRDDIDLALFLRRVEGWLLRCLPSRMVIGFHGRVGAVILLNDEGELELCHRLGSQNKYTWRF